MNAMTRLFLGVDGGQSSTTAVIGDETGRILGSGRGGPCNHVGKAEGRERFLNAMRESVGRACQSAGLERRARGTPADPGRGGAGRGDVDHA